jgi:hypothetical protein
MVRTVYHQCTSFSCPSRIPIRFLMCRHHWAMVPLELQERVNAAYRPGQSAISASDECKAAVREARAAVVAREAIDGVVVDPRHECLIRTCPTRIPKAVLVCRNHWRLLPRSVQRAVLSVRPQQGRELDPAWVTRVIDEATDVIRAAESSAVIQGADR